MRVKSLMTRHVHSCTPEDTLAQAAKRMWDNDIGALVVVDAEGRPIAMVTDRDICMAAYTQGVRLVDGKVATAMSRQLVTCTPDTSISELESVMNHAQVRRVPVVGYGDELVGIIALGDLARHSQEKPLGKALEGPAVSRTFAGIVARRTSLPN